jgi:hypothetical protein
MAASAGNASEPEPSNSPFVRPGVSPAGRPAARALRRRLSLIFFLLQAGGGYIRLLACISLPGSRLTPTFFFTGGRNANDLRS